LNKAKIEKKMKYPLEGLLRRPVEWISSTSYAIGSAFVLSQNYLLPPFLSIILAISFLIMSLWRFLQGFRVKRYQWHLKKIPVYKISSRNIPVSDKKLFLGKGFRWLPIHTQRLYDIQQTGNEKYLKPNKIYQWIVNLFADRFHLKFFIDRKNFLTSLGGNPALHGIEPNKKNIWLNLSERVGHMLVLGTTRVGKTRFLEVMVTQDIRRGDVVIVFDPKGDVDLLRRMVFEAKACGREDDLLIFHLGFPCVSARYNPIGNFARVTEVANRLANQLPNSGESAAFREFAWRFVNIIARALVALGRKPDYKQIQRYILAIDSLLLDYAKLWLPQINPHWEDEVLAIQNEIDERTLPLHFKTRSHYLIAIVKTIQKCGVYDAIAEGLCSAFNYDKTYFDKITASLLPLLEKLTTGQVAQLISPDYLDLNDTRPIFDWMQIIKGKKIVYVGLDALSDSTVASAVGSSMFSDLCSIAGQLYKFGVEEITSLPPHSTVLDKLANFTAGFKNNSDSEIKDKKKNESKTQYRISVHGDEFNEIANHDVTTLLNKGGGAGLQMTLYTQTWSDVEAKLGSAAKAGQVAGNLNTLVCLRVLEEATAKLLTSKLSQRVPIHTLQTYSSVSDASHLGEDAHFSSTNEDRITTSEVPLLMPSDLTQLPKGQAVGLINGSQPHQFCIPLPQDDMGDIPKTVEEIVLFLQK
jgi:conjugative coupling factor TraD (SXT/TOL subfamily)